MNIQLYTINHGPCPYLDDREWQTRFFMKDHVPEDIYESLINQGWRRSGMTFYTNVCSGCSQCIPIRVDTGRFVPSRSQKRTLSRNRDIEIKRAEDGYVEEEFHLLKKYNETWHKSETPVDKDAYIFHHTSSPVKTEIMRYELDGKLVGIGWVDHLPDSLSSVYFAFDPEMKKRNLGRFSMLKEIELCRELGKSWLHMGYYVSGCQKMKYKAQYKPHQLLFGTRWVEPRHPEDGGTL